jgi:Mrp family chromosome partitioning ATPase
MPIAEQENRIREQDQRIADNLIGIRHRIVVFSGKGGVGKTTISVNLAFGLSRQGRQVGILDADVTGPNVPKMLGVTDEIGTVHGRLIPQQAHGLKLVSLASMLAPDQAVIWRGPLRSKLLVQFLSDVEWGLLDYLVADLPPGTGDEILTITQKMNPALAVIVTTPQEVSLIDSRRAIDMARKMAIPRIGIIENMSGLTCPGCGHRIDLFGSGGGRRQAEEEGIFFLGALPIDPEARRLADQGRPILLEDEAAPISAGLLETVSRIETMVDTEVAVPAS